MLSASLFVAAMLAAAPSSPSYTIERWSIDAAGSGTGASASHAASGSLGRPDASAVLRSPSFQLVGGFHAPLPLQGELPPAIFSNGFEAPAP